MIRKGKGFHLAGGLLVVVLVAAFIWVGRSTLSAQEQEPVEEAPMNRVMQEMEKNPPDVQKLDAMTFTPCVGGTAGGYPCENFDLVSFTPIGTVGGSTGADLWGWTDPLDGTEYVIMNRQNGTGFLDISDPENPVYLGNLPTETGTTSWRDAKVYSDTVYIVSDGNGQHGMQVFDLTRLRNVASPPETFVEDYLYTEIGSAHNIVINEESGYAYAVGVSSGAQTCGGGLHIIDLSNPLLPTFVGCYSASGYTHDAQCVNYAGPDPDHQGDEICFNYNGNSGIYVVDVTNKAAPQELSFTSYPQQDYTHQGWVTDDHRYLVMNDELDEISFGINTRTRVFDVSNLDAPPVLIGFFDAPVASTDHNLYLNDGYAYAANYSSGLRVLDISDVANGNLSQAGYFDTYVPHNNSGFSGAWTAFPFFESGNIVVNSRGEGLFIVRPSSGLAITKSDPVGTIAPGETITYTIAVTNTGNVTATNVVVTDTLNGVDTVLPGANEIAPGSSEAYTFAYTIAADDCNTNLSNEASVSADSIPAIGTSVPVVTTVVCMEIAKSDPVGIINQGETISYTITVTNTGSVPATGVVVTDTLNGEDTVLTGAAVIGPGESETYIFAYTIVETDCDTNLSNEASVSVNGVWIVETNAPVVTPVTCDEPPETFYNYMPYAAKAD